MVARVPPSTCHTLGARKLRRESWRLTGEQWRCCLGDAWAVAPLGCVVAVVTSRMESADALPENVKCQMRIFRGGTGSLVTCVPWLVRLDTLMALQWTDSMLLAAIFRNSCVRVLSANGDFMHYFHLFFAEEVAQSYTIDSSLVTLCTWGGGAVYVSKEKACLYVQRGFEGRNCVHFPLGDYSLRISALGVLPHEDWLESVVIVARVDGACHVVMRELLKCRDHEDFQRCATEISHVEGLGFDEVVFCSHVAPGCEETYFALRDSSTNTVVSMCHRNGRVQELWRTALGKSGDLYVVGSGALALVSGDRITFLYRDADADQGASGSIDKNNFTVKPLCVSSDVGGGLRVFTASSGEFFKLVSPAAETVLTSYASDPASVLLRAYEMFQSGDVKACESLRLIRDDVMDAAATCVTASLDCWDIDTASTLLDAALFGRSMNSVQAERDHDAVSPGPAAESVSAAASMDGSVDSEKGRPQKNYAAHSSSRGIRGASSTGVGTSAGAAETAADAADTANSTAGARQGHVGAAEDQPVQGHATALAMIRVAKALRAAPSEICTNPSQLLAFGSRALVGMLAALRFHLLALKVADFLGADKKDVLLHWVHTRVKLGNHMTDEELVEVITKLLDGYAGVVLPYADIAEAAAKEKRETLALALLDRERSTLRKFSSLCSWGELNKAASVAAEACDTLYAAQLIHEAQVGSKLDRVVEISNSNSFVRDVFIKQCNLEGDSDVLQVFLERTDDIVGAGRNAVRRALEILQPRAAEAPESRPRSAMHQLVTHAAAQQNTQSEDCVTWLKYSSDFFRAVVASKNNRSPGVVETAGLWNDCVSQQRELLTAQAALERSSPELAKAGLVGRSLVHTVFTLYRLDMAKKAEALASKFRMPFNQLWRCQLAAAHEVQNINELLRMAMDKSAHSQYVMLKNGKEPVDLVLEALLSLGATNAVESVVATLRSPHQQRWRNRLNSRLGGGGSAESDNQAQSLFASLSKRIWN
ncbi:VACUOLAR PROTEIN SORTING VPS16, putative [Babesia bigemina]|uniref:VACUOLAR PROTEIN SORTING VPS16, putative n=1 Tax=Babesia bigemina TaxID=5866 RepID=A0A061DAI2_BABBI|nr:VACUOLAR PROTEIN SORTING VPS16, putative [Babesia bigemina]CDR94730.1 VACUOLAR PROTEIN SORTING VPS16, putative [Babesia bigemina]|eukprot:XP_012766916.1 VACUOLAR PROTEIN SORTING VPS16, putative [Babesia bigemina]